MAVVDLNSNEWHNNDGLLVVFGTDQARPSRGGEYSQLDSGEHCVEVTINLRNLTTDDLIVADNVTIPAGAMPIRVVTVATETAVGGTAINLGLVRHDRTTLIDADGFIAAAQGVIANMNADGETTIYNPGGTGGAIAMGALGGTVLANPGLIVASAAGTFTDGVIKARIYYIVPLAADID